MIKERGLNPESGLAICLATASEYKEIFYAFDLKSEIFAGISFRKASGFCYKQNSYYRGNAPHITLKMQMFK